MEKFRYRSTIFDGNSENSLKSQLKPLDIVKLKNGTIGFISYNELNEDGLAIYNPDHYGCLYFLNEYKDDLSNKIDIKRNIVAIYRGPQAYSVLEDLFSSETSDDIERSYLKNNWDIEISHVIQMTMEDIEKELGYKFELIH